MPKPKKITFEVYKSGGKTRIRATHRNGNKLFAAGTPYERKIDANTMLTLFINAIQMGDFEIVDHTKKK